MKTNLVSIVHCESYDKEMLYSAYKKSLDVLGGMSHFVKQGSVVTIKPNLLKASSPESAATTHPEAIRAVIRLVKEAGGIPKIVESPGGPATGVYVRSVFNSCGITKMASEEGVECCTSLQTCQVNVPDAVQIKKLNVLKALVDADVIINMPKPKPHGMMTFTGAVKNMFGSIAGTTKFDYHIRQKDYKDFANSLIDIFLAVKPSLNLMDGVVTMHKRGPASGVPFKSNFVMASEDAFAMDSTFLEMVGVDREKVLTLALGMERNLCAKSIDDLNIYLDGKKLSDISEIKLNNYIMPTENSSSSFLIPNFITKALRPKPVYNKKKCIKCKKCVDICPAKSLTMGTLVPIVDLEKCIRCYCCEELCPANAVDIKRFSL